MNQPGSFVHWSIFDVSVSNLVLIAVMVVIFGAALLLPFPRGHRPELADAAGQAGAAGQAAARSPARLCCVVGLRVRRGLASRARGGERVRFRAGSRRPGLVALQPGRALL